MDKWWQLLILILATVSGIPFMIWWILKVVRGKQVTLDLKKKSILIGSDGEEVEACPFDGDEAKCIYAPERNEALLKDFLQTRREEWLLQEKIFDLRKTIMQEQMVLAENLSDDTIAELSEIYSDELRAVYPDTAVFSTDDYKVYSNLLKIVREELLNQTRRRCRENHFAQKAPEDFFRYVESNLETMQNVMSRNLDELYPSFLKISRDRLRDRNLRDIDKILKIGRRFFAEARAISADIEYKIEGMRAESDKVFMERFGKGE